MNIDLFIPRIVCPNCEEHLPFLEFGIEGTVGLLVSRNGMATLAEIETDFSDMVNPEVGVFCPECGAEGGSVQAYRPPPERVDPWADADPVHTVSAWKDEVVADATRLGYHSWVRVCQEADAHNAELTD